MRGRRRRPRDAGTGVGRHALRAGYRRRSVPRADRGGQAAVRTVLDDALGPADWHVDRPAQEVACPPRTAVPTPGKFYPVEYSRPEVLDHASWQRVWARVVQALSPLGFRPEAGDTAERVTRTQAGAHFGYPADRHGDSLTVSTATGVGTGYGGFGACHPW